MICYTKLEEATSGRTPVRREERGLSPPVFTMSSGVQSWPPREPSETVSVKYWRIIKFLVTSNKVGIGQKVQFLFIYIIVIRMEK